MSEAEKYPYVTMNFVALVNRDQDEAGQRRRTEDIILQLEDTMYNWNLNQDGKTYRIEFLTAREIRLRSQGVIDLEEDEASGG